MGDWIYPKANGYTKEQLMAVTYSIDDRFCPKGHSWVRVNSSFIFSDCYYCEKCDKIYQPTVKEVSKKWFKNNFNSDRFEEIKQLALIIKAKEKVTKEDLQKLGYLNKK